MSIVFQTPSNGSVTIAEQDTASNVTVTVPARTANVMLNGPAFSAYQSSAQGFTANVSAKVQFQTKEFDTANCFDNITNYRFTPNVAGYYQVFGAFTNATNVAGVALNLYKNGSAFKRLYSDVNGGNTSSGCGGCILYMNGTTDYIELYALTTVSQNSYAFADSTYFQAAMVRGA